MRGVKAVRATILNGEGRLGRGKWMDLIGPVFGWLRWVSEMSECFGEAESRDRSEEGSDGGRGNGNRIKLFWGLGQLDPV